MRLTMLRSALLCSAMSLAFNAYAQSPGTLDPAFGEQSGLTVDRQRDPGNANDVIGMPDGGWVVSGSFFQDNEGKLPDKRTALLSRYRADGTLDTTFGVEGDVESSLPLVVDGSSSPVLRDGSRLYQVVVDEKKLHVLAYNFKGDPDPTYGIGGVATVQVDGFVHPVIDAVLQNGRVLIAAGRSAPTYKFMLARLDGSGQLDSSFGTGGTYFGQIYSGPGTANIFTGVALQADGKIVVAGRARQKANAYEMVVGRFSANGSPDSTFGTLQGFRTFKQLDNDYGRSVALLDDGRIVVAGTACAVIDAPSGEQSCYPAAARLFNNGTFDSTFGAGGKTILAGVGQNDYSIVLGLAVDSRHRVVIAGQTRDNSASLQNAGYLLRLTDSGALDTGFGQNGTLQNAYREQQAGNVSSVLLTSLDDGIVPVPRLITVGSRTLDSEAVAESVIARHVYDDAGSAPSE